MNGSDVNFSPAYFWTMCDHYNDDNGPSAGLVILLTAHSLEFLLGLPSNVWLIYHILRQRSKLTGVLPSDVFPLNLALVQLFFSLVQPQFFINHFLWRSDLVLLALDYLTSGVLVGKPLLYSLLCVERYLAVVRPVDYLRFKASRYRRGCLVALWSLTIVITGVGMTWNKYITQSVVFLPALAVDTLCSLSILKTLKRPPPGDGREMVGRTGGQRVAGMEGRKAESRGEEEREGKVDKEQKRANESGKKYEGKEEGKEGKGQNGREMMRIEEIEKSSRRERMERSRKRRKRRGDGEMDSMKRTAFITVTIIQAVLTVSYLPLIVTWPMNGRVPFETLKCQYYAMAQAAAISCSYLQPLLYLHRLGRLPCLTLDNR